MKNLILVFIAVLTFSIVGNAQTDEVKIESGKPADLKGLTKVYVETMGDLKENERIVERLTKAKVPNLQIVEDIQDAEIILVFGGDNFSAIGGITSNRIGDTVYTTPTRVNLLQGEGRVFVASADGKKLRLVMRVQNEQETKLEKRPVTKFVNEFIKVYKKVNEIK